MGKRAQYATNAFIEGLSQAVAPRQHFQITTDGFRPYRAAIDATLGHRVDFAQLIKVYRSPQDGEARYSPSEVASTEVVIGRPDPERICTSIIERSNLSLRMGLRRFTRFTNASSKKWENHWAAVTVWYTLLLQNPQITSRDSCHGSRDCGSRVDDSGTLGIGKLLR